MKDMGSENSVYNYWTYDPTMVQHVERVGRDMIRELYDKISMEDWFEDKQIVEKEIPEFKFV